MNKALFDEVTSGLDKGTENKVYSAISSQITSFISVGTVNAKFSFYIYLILFNLGHRETLLQFHTHELRIFPHQNNSFEMIPIIH
jgi:ABC-type uncharacterized transport system fused permease/ATPase subunit